MESNRACRLCESWLAQVARHGYGASRAMLYSANPTVERTATAKSAVPAAHLRALGDWGDWEKACDQSATRSFGLRPHLSAVDATARRSCLLRVAPQRHVSATDTDATVRAVLGGGAGSSASPYFAILL